MLTRQIHRIVSLTMMIVMVMGCQQSPEQNVTTPTRDAEQNAQQNKVIIYQVFTRLFGNTNTTNKPWGTLEENGVGKFADFSPKALNEIRKLGVSHVWYTGVPHHASVTDYSAFGIQSDDPDVVKGRAGSPYAVRDYYNVDPDLAVDPTHRLAEFEALIQRTHDAGLKVIIDIVPNHVARRYDSITRPETTFGIHDDTTVTYNKNNNFYYLPGEKFEVPDFTSQTVPLGGEAHPLVNGEFDEFPARWTGNGASKAKPDVNDWYETVKINYGVSPNGVSAFPAFPDSLSSEATLQQHANFWQDKTVPDSWIKFRDIALYWLDKGVDGFRYDMAEMVPVAFWSYLNSAIKQVNPDALLLAEVYQPALYRDYIHLGKMDYLYDKVDFYDSLKGIMQGNGNVSALDNIQQQYADIAHHMLHFLENHDEQRIASPDFAGDPLKGKPALVVSALISASPMLIYFGQEVGEDGSEALGFGQPTRTSIFDYGGVPAHQRWMNNAVFDGGALSEDEAALRDYYFRVLNIARTHPAASSGEYRSLQRTLLVDGISDDPFVFAFQRHTPSAQLISVSNFYSKKTVEVTLTVPDITQLDDSQRGAAIFTDLLSDTTYTSNSIDGKRIIQLKLEPLQSVILSR